MATLTTQAPSSLQQMTSFQNQTVRFVIQPQQPGPRGALHSQILTAATAPQQTILPYNGQIVRLQLQPGQTGNAQSIVQVAPQQFIMSAKTPQVNPIKGPEVLVNEQS